jgi:hypothetical protein
MERRVQVAIVIIVICVAVDATWALLNQIIPELLGYPVDLVVSLPGPAITDWLILWYFIPLLSLPLYVFPVVIVSRWLALPINKLLNPGQQAYYFGPKTTRETPVMTLLRRSLFAVFLMFGIALSITKFFPAQCAILSYIPEFDAYPIFNEMNQAIILMPLIFPFLALILPTSWLIEDCDIVFLTYPSTGPQELRGAGRTLTTLLKGFAGIFVIIDYLRLAYNIAVFFPVWQSVAPPWVPLWFYFIIAFVNPFVYLFIPILALLVYDAYFPRLRDALVQYMKHIGTMPITRLAEADVDISEVLGSKEKPAE